MATITGGSSSIRDHKSNRHDVWGFHSFSFIFHVFINFVGMTRRISPTHERVSFTLPAMDEQVCKLDENDPEVGHVVKDLKENGEPAFQKYAMDQQLGMLLQKKCMVQAVGEQVRCPGVACCLLSSLLCTYIGT